MASEEARKAVMVEQIRRDKKESGWRVEAEGEERILRRYFTSPEGHPMKRDVAIFCNWNGKLNMEQDEAEVLEVLNKRQVFLPKNVTLKETLKWLRERYENSVTIANQKTGEDKMGWLEDAAMFESAIRYVECGSEPGGVK